MLIASEYEFFRDMFAAPIKIKIENNINMMKSNIELSNKRIENAKKRIAKCINILQTTVEEVKWACEAEDWNDDVAYEIESAVLKLGCSLATLYRWNDPEEEFKDE